MSDPQEAIKRWLAKKLDERHGEAIALAKHMKLAPTAITRMKNLDTQDPKTRRQIKPHEIEQLARFFNELPPGYERMTQWLNSGRIVAAEVREQPRVAVTRIPDLAIFAGMGGGGLLEVLVDEQGVPTDPDQVRGYWEFPDYMLRRFGNLKNIYAWEVRGDSMEPTLAGGAVVFVDISQRRLPPDDIYALDAGDGLVVKRLRLVPRSEHVEIISDNEDHYPRDRLLREEVTVWGRVIGWFQWRG